MMLQLRHIKKSFGGIPAINNCSISLAEGVTALIGPNGAGKTTLFDIISGFSSPDSGKVWWNNVDITKLSPEKRVKLGIVRTFQLVRIFPNLTVLENVVYAKKQFSERPLFVLFRRKKMKLEQEEIELEALKILEHVGLESQSDVLASELSFGQQKLLELARAIILKAELILLDEPAAGVNPLMRENLKVIIMNLKRYNIPVFLIEHDMSFVMDVADHVVVLNNGKEIASGSPSEIKSNKEVLDAYLGRQDA